MKYNWPVKMMSGPCRCQPRPGQAMADGGLAAMSKILRSTPFTLLGHRQVELLIACAARWSAFLTGGMHSLEHIPDGIVAISKSSQLQSASLKEREDKATKSPIVLRLVRTYGAAQEKVVNSQKAAKSGSAGAVQRSDYINALRCTMV